MRFSLFKTPKHKVFEFPARYYKPKEESKNIEKRYFVERYAKNKFKRKKTGSIYFLVAILLCIILFTYYILTSF